MAWSQYDEDNYQYLQELMRQTDQASQASAPKQNKGALGDIGTSLKIGVQKLPGAVTGLLDIPVALATGDRMVSKGWEGIGELTGFQPGKWAEQSEQQYSPGYRQGRQAVDEAWQQGGVGNIAAAYATNPGQIINTVAQSLPGMVAGGVMGRAALGASRAVQGAALGEGALSAGMQMEEIDPNVDARLAAGTSLAAGALTGLIGLGSGTLARRLGLGDLDVALAGGNAAVRAPMSLGRRIGGGAVTEGLLEEMPQSMQEQFFQNLAEGRPLGEGVARAGVEGALSGGLMGGAFNAFRRYQPPVDTPPAPEPRIDPGTQGALDLGDAGGPAAGAVETPLQVGELQARTENVLTEYRQMADIARQFRDAPEGTPQRTLGDQAIARLGELQGEMRELGMGRKETSEEGITKVLGEVEKRVSKLSNDYNAALQENPDKATSILEKLRDAQGDQQRLKSLLTPNPAQGELFTPTDLTQKTPTAKAKTATQPAANPDPLLAGIQQSATAAFRKDGSLNKSAEKAYAAYQGLSDSELDAAIKEFTDPAAQKRDGSIQAWRLPMLNALKESRATSTQQVAGQTGTPQATQAEVQTPVTAQANADLFIQGAQNGSQAEVQSPVPAGPAQALQEGGNDGRRNANEGQDAPLQGQADAVQEGRSGGQEGLLDPEAEREAQRTQVQQILGKLTDRQRQILTMYHFDKLPFEQIGAELNPDKPVSRQAVEQQHKTAFKRLLKEAKPLGLTEERLRVYFPDESVRQAGGAGVQTLSAAEVAQSGANLSYRNESENGAVNQANDEGGELDAGALSYDAQDAPETFDEAAPGATAVQEDMSDMDVVETVAANLQEALRESSAFEIAQMYYPELQEVDVQDAAQDWELSRLEGQPTWAQLNAVEQAAFIRAYMSFTSEDGLNAKQYETAQQRTAAEAQSRLGQAQPSPQRDAGAPRREVPASGASRPAEQAPSQRSNEGATQGRTEPAEVDADLQSAQDLLNQRVDALYEQLGETQRHALDMAKAKFIETGNLQRLLDEIENYEGLVSAGSKYSIGTREGRSTVEAVQAALRPLFFSNTRFGNKITIVQTVGELRALTELKSVNINGDTQGFVRGNKAYLVAENIAQGNELAVFLHEVGVHLGMAKLLGPQNFARLEQQVVNWASGKEGSQEYEIARAAMRRVAAAQLKNGSLSQEDMREETIAYFVEEAVRSGINPVALDKLGGPMAAWFRTLWASVKAALRKFGLDRVERLTAQDVVNLAYGAARLELEGTYHGTAADFRRFNHEYMGSGEGAQAYGWGTYLAQRKGIAKGYFEADVGRKTEGGGFRMADGTPVTDPGLLHDLFGAVQSGIDLDANYLQRLRDSYEATLAKWSGNSSLKRDAQKLEYSLTELGDIQQAGGVVYRPRSQPEGSLMRVDSAVHEDEMLDWDKPLSEQSERVKQALNATGNYKVDDFLEGERGSGVYGYLEAVLGSDKAASEYLDSIGIKGIKFLDAQSRGTRNYKIVPDNGRFFALQVMPSGYTSNIIGDANGYATESEAAAAAEHWKGGGSTRNLVIFNDKNIVRVVTHPGAKRDQVKYSIRDSGEALRNVAANAVRLEDVRGVGRRTMLGLLTLDQLTKRAQEISPNLGKAVEEYQGAVRAMGNAARTWINKAAPIERTWFSLGKEVDKRLSAVMKEATLLQYDPAAEEPKAEKPERLERMQRLQKTYNDLILNAPKAKDVYEQVRDHFKDTMAERTRIMQGLINATYDGNIAEAERLAKEATGKDAKKAQKRVQQLKNVKADALKEHAQAVRQLKGPYFPLKRFGKFVVVGMSEQLATLTEQAQEEQKRDGRVSAETEKAMERLKHSAANYTVESFERESAASARARELEAKGLTVQSKVAEEFQHETMSLTNSRLNDIADHLAAELKDTDAANAVRAMLGELYIRSLPENHALKRQLRRQGIEGATDDMRRAFSATAISDAHYMSRLKFGEDMRKAVFDIKQAGKAGKDQGEIRNEVIKRVGQDMQYSNNPLVDMATNVSWLANIGFSPAYILTNMTQVPMITLPWLASKRGVGLGRASRALWGAMADATKLVKASYVPNGKLNRYAELDLTKVTDPGERAMLEDLLGKGLLDVTIEHDLGSVASGSLAPRGWNEAMRMLSIPVHLSETNNRLITALAAYRLAKEQGPQAAARYAEEAVKQTQLDYTAENAPRLMRGSGLARLVSQFKRYAEGMAWLITTQIRDAVKGAPEQKAQARKMLGFLFGMQMMMGGVLGLPIPGSLGLLLAQGLGSAGGDGDEPFDPEVEIRNFLADLFGEDVGRALAKGVPAALGMDMSKKAGMGDVFNPLSFMRGDAQTGTGWVGNALVAALGPSAGVAANMIDAMQFMGDGQYVKGLEKMLPMKFVSDALRSYRYANEGMTTRSGDMALPAEKFDGWDIIMRAMGFTPSRESEAYAAKSAVEGAKTAATQRRSELLREYAQARIAGEDTSDIEDAMRSFSERHPEQGWKIDYSAKVRAVQSYRKRLSSLNDQGVVMDKRTKPFEELGRFAEGV